LQKNTLEDILNKLGWALLLAFGIMVIIIGVILYQNNFTEEPEVKISAFYFIISIIFLGSGIYFRKLSKKV
jgi:TRAP-type C4-dicarboxylate transport system permease small subunit